MAEYEKMTQRQRKWMFYLLAALVLGAGFTPYSKVFLGLILGSVFSFYNLWILQQRVKGFGDAVERGEKPRGLGTAARFAAAAVTIILAGKYQAYVNVIAVIIGLITSYLVMVIDFLIFQRNKSDIKEGESNGA